jgi:DNA end-binding protein Ku
VGTARAMAPRSIWSGSISFGLVNVPVRMYSAIDEQDLHFHLLHEKDDGRIGYAKVCKKDGKPVPDDEIVRAYEFDDGEYVYITDEDLAAAEGDSLKTIEIQDFVPYDEIDPIYFEKGSYLGPAEGGEKVYALLLRAMEDSGLAGIATYVMRDKQHLGCLRVRDRVIVLERMFFADEIRDPGELAPKRAAVGKRELAMAAELIDRFTSSFDPGKYSDTYREALLRVVRDKRKGKEIHVEARSDEGPELDLLEALRQSVEAHGRRHGANGKLGALSKAELEARARKAGIEGRSKMSKRELVEALEK